jgi:hypothetical protein
MDPAERDRLLSQAYTAAQKRLREEYKDRFNTLYGEEAKARNIDWQPRKSKEEQALATIQELLEQYPGAADKLAEQLGSREGNSLR